MLCLLFLNCLVFTSAKADQKSPAFSANTITTRFTNSTELFLNPERGFVGNVGDITKASQKQLDTEALRFRLIRSYIRLDQFIDRKISKEFLDQLERGFEQTREAGVKVIPRFSYNHATDASIPGQGMDPPIRQVEQHIAQLGPVLTRHQDIIAFIEAGFIGAWGEWHSSVSKLDKPENRIRVRNALLSNFPASRFLLFRYPKDHQAWYESSVTWKDATGRPTAKSRSGFHNDCLLTGLTDGNTYSVDNPSLRQLVKNSARYVPYGGETCALPNPNGSCAGILSVGALYSLTYLNWYYYRPAFHEKWAAQGCLDRVDRLLGYRLELQALSHPARAAVGESISVLIDVMNIGWARLHNKREMLIHLIDSHGVSHANLVVKDINPTLWLPRNSETHRTVSQGQAHIPIATPTGKYTVAISLPDKSPSLQNDPRYAIRFANSDRRDSGQYWDSVTGRFMTGTTIWVEKPR